jgi:hypothetical protein
VFLPSSLTVTADAVVVGLWGRCSIFFAGFGLMDGVAGKEDFLESHIFRAISFMAFSIIAVSERDSAPTMAELFLFINDYLCNM